MRAHGQSRWPGGGPVGGARAGGARAWLAGGHWGGAKVGSRSGNASLARPGREELTDISGACTERFVSRGRCRAMRCRCVLLSCFCTSKAQPRSSPRGGRARRRWGARNKPRGKASERHTRLRAHLTSVPFSRGICFFVLTRPCNPRRRPRTDYGTTAEAGAISLMEQRNTGAAVLATILASCRPPAN